MLKGCLQLSSRLSRPALAASSTPSRTFAASMSPASSSSPSAGSKRPNPSSPGAEVKKARLTGTDSGIKKAADVLALDEADPFDADLDEAAMIAAAEEAESIDASSSSQPSLTSTPTQKGAAPSSSAATTPRTTPASVKSSSLAGPSKPAPASIFKPAPAATTQISSASLADPSDPLRIERETMDKEWFARLEPEMRKDSFKQLKQFLANEVNSKQKIYPPPHLIHSWSRLTPLNKVKVVVVGQDPYHGPNQACGHSFSVARGVPIPGSLRNIYKELSNEYGVAFKAPSHGCLDRWAEQGVLLLNACLTVRAGAAASHHGKGWEPLTKAVLKLVADEASKGAGGAGSSGGGSIATSKIASMFAKKGAKIVEAKTGKESSVGEVAGAASQPEAKQGSTTAPAGEAGEDKNGGPTKGVVFLVWGQPAAKTVAEAGITDKTPNVLILRSPHPSPLSANRGFLGNGHFKKANDWLEDVKRHGKGGGIRWAQLD